MSRLARGARTYRRSDCAVGNGLMATSDLGAEPLSMTSAEFAQFIVEETEKWGKVVKFAGIKPE